jgi:hypothetical protein
MRFHRVALISLAFALTSGSVGAQLQTNITRMHFKPEETAVWAVIDKEWGRSGCCGRENLMTNLRYLDLVSDDAIVWFWGAAAPMTKESMRTSDGALETPDKPWVPTRVAYELYPEGLVIHGNTAVAHYRCRVATVDKDNKLESSNCRFTDILVRDRPGAEWKFLSWVGGELRKQE